MRRAAQSSFYPRFTVRGANLTRKFHALWRKIFASLRLRGESYAAFSADMQRHEESLRRFLVAAMRGLEVKRADAAAAGGVAGDIQGSAEIDRLRAVENFHQRVPACISNRWMEEARSDGPVLFHDGRNPGRVAARRDELRETQMSPKMTHDPPELFGRLQDETGILPRILDQPVNLLFQEVNLVPGERDLGLALRKPWFRTVESGGGEIRGQKRDRPETQDPRRARGFAQVPEVLALHRAACRDGIVRVQLMERADPGGQKLEGAGDAADPVVDFGGTVEGNDRIVQAARHRMRAPGQQDAGAQGRGSNAHAPEQVAEAKEVGVHERLAAGKHDPAHAQSLYVARMAPQVIHTDFPHGVDFPDVAHHTAAIAAAVGLQHKDRQGCDYVRFGHFTSEYHVLSVCDSRVV